MPTLESTSRISQLTHAIEDSARDGLVASARNGLLTGLSGEMLVGMLQRFAAMLPASGAQCYCEVGVFQGLTLLSTAHANPAVQCFGIDNFSQFDSDGTNERLIRSRTGSLGIRNARLVNADFEDALANANEWLDGHRIGVYFVDGPHDYRSQIVCLLAAKRLLAPGAVIVVDDSNYEHVRRANADFLGSHDDFALLFEAYTPCHPANMSEHDRARAMRGWWNGVNVMVHDPEGLVPRRLPPTGDSALYIRSHDVFRAEFAADAADALRFCGRLCDADDAEMLSLASDLRTSLRKTRADHPDRFVWQNTESGGLPEFRLHSR